FPRELGDFILAGACQNQELDGSAKGVGEFVGGVPHRAQFVIGQHAITPDFASYLGQVRHGINGDDVPAHRPTEKTMEMSMHSTCHNRGTTISDGVNQLYAVATSNACDGPITPYRQHIMP